MSIPEISVEELAEALAGPINLIDVREIDEYVSGHVAGAISVPLATVPDEVERLRAMGPLVIICQAGGRSMRACEFLAAEGLTVTNVAGGTGGWRAVGNDVVIGHQP